jgi:dTDP-4-amino-4,6-dideoxygalactose transaminase
MSDIKWWNLKLEKNYVNNICEAYDNRYLSYGPIGKELEKKIQEVLNVKFAMLTTSGSTALAVALKALKIMPGDEVILPNRTFQATASAPFLIGAVVKLVDVNPDTGLMDIDKIESVISPKTKAIIVVHLNGKSANLEELLKIKKKYNLKVIEDSAQAFYSKYNDKFLGTIGDIGCFSMGVTKFSTCGQGGFITTNDPNLHMEMTNYLFHGQSGSDDKQFNSPGFNFRLPDILSSLALPQFSNLEAKKEKFLIVYKYYERELSLISQVKLLKCSIDRGEIPIWIEILSSKRDMLYNFLKENKIETMKFYPSLNKSSYLNAPDDSAFLNSVIFETQGLILPCGPDVSLEIIKKVTNTIREFYQI